MKKNKKNFDQKSENKVEKTNSSEIVVEGTVIEAFPNVLSCAHTFFIYHAIMLVKTHFGGRNNKSEQRA